MKNDKLLVPNMFSVPIFKHIFSNLPLDYVCVCVCVCFIKNVKYTDQDGNTETSIMFFDSDTKGHADVSSSENILM